MRSILITYSMSFILTLVVGGSVLYFTKSGEDFTAEPLAKSADHTSQTPSTQRNEDVTPQQNETEAIIQAARSFLISDAGMTDGSFTLEVDRRVDEYAVVINSTSNPNNDMGKGLVILQKVDGTWRGVERTGMIEEPSWCKYPKLFPDFDCSYYQ